MRKLAIFGAFGGVNFGDEMILRAVISKIRSEGYHESVNVIVGSYPGEVSRVADYAPNGLFLLCYKKPFKLARALIGSDLFLGGGQLIDGGSGLRQPLLYLFCALIVKLSGGRFRIAGVSTSRLTRRPIRLLYRLLFALADSINLRDAQSAKEVDDIIDRGAAGWVRKTSVSADLVFSLKNEIVGDVPAQCRKKILFAVHHAERLQLTPVDLSVQLLTKIRAHVPADHDVGLIAHDVRENFDLKITGEICSNSGLSDLPVFVPQTTDELLREYHLARTIISIRMHPIIIGSCAGCHCVPLEGSRKQADLANRLQIPVHGMRALIDMDTEEFMKVLGIDGSNNMLTNDNLTLLVERAIATPIIAYP